MKRTSPSPARARRAARFAGATARRAGALAATALAMAGCTNLDRLGEVGSEPRLTHVQDPTAQPGYQPVTMPMPPAVHASRAPNSLWRTGSRAFFKDQRASSVGDILTVIIEIDDSASLNNSTKRSRANTESAAADAMLGYEASLHQILPEAIDNTNLIDLNSETSNNGSGTISRGEDIELKIAAVVVQTLPNGNLVLKGRQEVRVNYEMRELEISGVIRPEDINSDNTVSYEKVAEARIAYGGRGHVSDVQQPRIGTQVYDILFPF